MSMPCKSHYKQSLKVCRVEFTRLLSFAFVRHCDFSRFSAQSRRYRAQIDGTGLYTVYMYNDKMTSAAFSSSSVTTFSETGIMWRILCPSARGSCGQRPWCWSVHSGGSRASPRSPAGCPGDRHQRGTDTTTIEKGFL